MTVTIKKTITKAMFWSLVAKMNWAEDYDYTRIKRWILKNLDEPTVASFRVHLDACMNKLEATVGDDIGGVSDDSWSDVRASIIGCGEDTFNEAIASYRYVQRIIDNDQYQESFVYAIPYEDDWSKLADAPNRATVLLTMLSKQETPVSNAGRMILADVIDRLVAIQRGDLQTGIQNWDKSMYNLWREVDGNYSAVNLIQDVQNYS